MNELINGIIFEIFDDEILREANDSAILPKFSKNLAFSTDSFVITPRFFSGGNIGTIAACGTINDLAMVGAMAKYLSCALIIEEGFLISELKQILLSMKQVAKNVGARIVCGDTKVVPKGKCDGIFINTAGIGEILCDARVQNLQTGAKILLSGDIGRHGSVILQERQEINFSSNLTSDCKALNGVVKALIDANVKILAMRDATRGGISAVLNEWAQISKNEILINESRVKICDEVLGICELLGFEPFELANEGTFVLAVSKDDAQKALEILAKFDENSSIIGEFTQNKNERVILQNAYGSKRFLEKPKGELLPRIC